MYNYNAKVLKVVDGDTIDCLVDLGFEVWIKVRVRLQGINTPECRTRDLEEKEKGLAAKERVKILIEINEDEVELESFGVGKYGRCLGKVYIKKVTNNSEDINEGFTLTCINDLLIKEGHATEYDGGSRG